MDRTTIKTIIETLDNKIESIENSEVKEIQKTLLNLIELLMAENEQLRIENKKLRDEINRMKGGSGKPSIRPQSKFPHNFSSEQERSNKNKKKKKNKDKKYKINVDRTELCKIDKTQLPSDVVFKGYESVIIQDILIKTNNIEFKKETYYSPALKKTFIAPLPKGYHGEFGPTIRALILDLHHTSKMTESALHRFFENQGIHISAATISRMLTQGHEQFHQEKKDIVQAGLLSSIHQQMDDTGARVNGKNYYTHILCNLLYTAYFTRRHKDRLTILEILTQGELTFCFNECAYTLMKNMKLSDKRLMLLKQQDAQPIMNRKEIDHLLKELFPNPKKHQSNRRIILEATAIAAYQQLPHAIAILLTDDAPQFKQITAWSALCWVHDGRHYKKLDPVVYTHQEKLKNFLEKYWCYYEKLLDYQKSPSSDSAELLSTEFDTLFSTKTNYTQLDERIEKTRFKKASLLQVLKYPHLPLHNNASELGARTQARYRDISFHTINKKGTEAKDTFMTVVETAKKLMVNTYYYFLDRISKKFEMPSLASLIKTRTQEIIYHTG